jgi:uncharacterized membrane protein
MKRDFMSDLIVVGYDDEFNAEDVRLMLLKMKKDYLIDLEDAAIAIKNEKVKIKLDQMLNLTTAGVLSGLLFMNPILGIAVGTATGAV